MPDSPQPTQAAAPQPAVTPAADRAPAAGQAGAVTGLAGAVAGLAGAVASWRADLAAVGGTDPLTRYRDLPDGTLDLGSAHPSGLAGFLAGRPTLLSSLFREPAALSDARRRARAVRLAATALADEHGLRAAHLAVGMVSWRDGDDTVTGPVLLRPLTLRPRGVGQSDYDLSLGGPVRTNPALVRLLAAAGHPLDPRELESLATRGPGFDPTPAFDRLADVAGGLPGLVVRQRLVVGTFVDLAPALVAELDRLAPGLAGHDVVAALAGDTEARSRLAAAARSRGPRVADGTDDVRALPLDADQRAVLQAVVSGRSVRVETPPGTGATQLLAGLLAALAVGRRRVLLVAAQRAELADVVARLAAVGLQDIVQVPGDVAPPPASGVPEEPRSGHAGDPMALLRRQHQALHARRDPWGVSALQALHELTALTARRPAPRTTVQLQEPVLRRLDGPARARAAAALREAADLGVFERSARSSPWYGARLTDDAEAEQVLTVVRDLAEQRLPALRAAMDRVAADAGLAPAGSVGAWSDQLELLLGVRDTLDLFTPAVYERPVTQMVAATASSRWRAEHGVQMGVLQRRRWEKQARELVRPGVAVPDLHAALVAAQAQREQWQRASRGGGWPRVPFGLAEVDAVHAAVVEQLRRLETVLAGTEEGGRLLDVPLGDLQRRLERLAADAGDVPLVARRTAALDALGDLGLDALVADLIARAVPAQTVAAELDLAWWRSLLQLLLAGDPDLAAADAAAHAAALEAVRSAELRRQGAVVRSVRDAVAVAGAAPVVATTPMALPQEVGADARFDVVVLAGGHRVGTAEAVLALARAPQVVVLGDPAGLPPTPVVVAGENPSRTGASAADAPPRPGVLDLLVDVLPTHRLRHQHRMPAAVVRVADAVRPRGGDVPATARVPAPPRLASADLVLVPDGVGSPDADGGVESVQAEVDRVVALVLEHARTRPQESLAVLTLGPRHARRVADALRADLPDHPDVARWLAAQTWEPFVVTDTDRCEDAVRDSVVLSVGFARTPHGRVLHRFGRLDADGGDRRLAVVASRARRHLTVVSCLTAADLDPDRLRTPGARGLRSLLEALEASEAPDDGAAAAGHRLADPLLADPLLADLADRLAARGHDARVGPGGVPDLVVDADGERPTAVVTDLHPADVPEEALSDALVVRHLLLPDQLRRFGWRVVRVGAVGLFTDPEAQVDRVLGTEGGGIA
ncbi:DUF4011 domain-containing protein [Quadrisphaera sp. GCM10027208]|uniref:DUF4011 domain-containing protein n=1 Tax=Quadrisphaera sp. GCM10027208 TaxID=3273423 RepID=UPI00360F7F6E